MHVNVAGKTEIKKKPNPQNIIWKTTSIQNRFGREKIKSI